MQVLHEHRILCYSCGADLWQGQASMRCFKASRSVEQSQYARLLLDVETCKKKDCEHVMNKSGSSSRQKEQGRERLSMVWHQNVSLYLQCIALYIIIIKNVPGQKNLSSDVSVFSVAQHN